MAQTCASSVLLNFCPTFLSVLVFIKSLPWNQDPQKKINVFRSYSDHRAVPGLLFRSEYYLAERSHLCDQVPYV
jgi:hypothetical protein